QRGSIPEATDKIFVIYNANHLFVELPLNTVLTQSTDKRVSDVMKTDTVSIMPEEKGEDAAGAFERYDLISAAVDERN
ncbi:magnesium transporter, partial [Proteus mirabilis]|nr:magnesium transporter [Proteus mirabilis]